MATSTRLPHIAILGTGSMGGAILSGLVRPEVEVDGGITVTNRSREKAAALAHLPGVTSLALTDEPDANRRAAAEAAVVLVAVKPAMVPDLLREIADVLTPGTIVVSVAAGVTVATFEDILPEHVSVIRSMPNTPSIVGRGLAGISAGSRSSAEDLAVVRALFETVGEVLEVPESKLDALSTISGSGPAYVFYLIEEFTRTAIAKGFTPEEADLMVSQTFLGAAELLVASDKTAEELRIQVTSPKGTTERAIAVLETAGLERTFTEATDAALARSRELAAPTAS